MGWVLLGRQYQCQAVDKVKILVIEKPHIIVKVSLKVFLKCQVKVRVKFKVKVNLNVNVMKTIPEVYSSAWLSTLPLSKSVIPDVAKI